jgi:hypothetical protein
VFLVVKAETVLDCGDKQVEISQNKPFGASDREHWTYNEVSYHLMTPFVTPQKILNI